MTTTPAEVSGIQTLAGRTQALADALAAGQVTGAQQSSLESIVCSLYQQVYDLVPDPTTGYVPMPAPPGYTTKWLEETWANLNQWNTFYGPGSRWDVHNFGAPYSSGGSNQAAYWAPSQVGLANGIATLTARPTVAGDVGYGTLPFVSGCLTTKIPLPTVPHFVQVKAKMPDTSAGMWPAIWELPSNSAQEWDIFEGGWLGNSPNTQGHSALNLPPWYQNVWATPADMSQGFHIYGGEFIPGNPGLVTAYFDGVKKWSKSANLSALAYYLFLQLQVASAATKGWHTYGGDVIGSMQIQEVQVWTK